MILSELNLYPNPDNIQNLEFINEYEGLNSKDLIRIVNRLIAEANLFEPEFGLSNLEIDDICIEPNLDQDCLDNNLVQEHKNLIVKSALVEHTTQKPIFGHYIYTKVVANKALKVHAKILSDKINLNRAASGNTGKIQSLKGQANLFSNINDLINKVSKYESDESMFEINNIRFLIQADFYVKRNVQNFTSEWEKLPIPKIEREFCSDCKIMFKSGDKSFPKELKDTIFDIVFNKGMRKNAHPMQVGKGGSQKNIIKNGMTEMRANVGRKGLAYRLHYWLGQNKEIKLKSVGIHEKEIKGLRK